METDDAQAVRSHRRAVSAPVRWAIRSQVVLLLALLSCTVLMPGFLFSRNMGGVSNYGVHWRTVVPYSVGVLGEVACLLRVHALLRSERGRRARTVRAALIVICCAVTINVLTTYPYKRGDIWAAVHSSSGVALAVVELTVAAVLVRQTTGGSARAAFWLVVVGFALLVLTYTGFLFILFVAEVVTAVGAGVLIILAVRAVADPGTSRPARGDLNE